MDNKPQNCPIEGQEGWDVYKPTQRSPGWGDIWSLCTPHYFSAALLLGWGPFTASDFGVQGHNHETVHQSRAEISWVKGCGEGTLSICYKSGVSWNSLCCGHSKCPCDRYQEVKGSVREIFLCGIHNRNEGEPMSLLLEPSYSWMESWEREVRRDFFGSTVSPHLTLFWDFKWNDIKQN